MDNHTKLSTKKIIQDAILFSKKYLLHQGPLDYFVHHNTLHSFEEYSFFDALTNASSLYGAKTNKSLRWYQSKLSEKRITKTDLETSIYEHFKQVDFSNELISKADFLEDVIFFNTKYCSDFTSLKKEKFQNEFQWKDVEVDPKFLPVTTVWDFIKEDKVKEILFSAVDSVRLKVLSAYFDKGIAYWQMEDRSLGLLHCFLENCRHKRTTSWQKHLRKIVDNLYSTDKKDLYSIIEDLLLQLEVPDELISSYIFTTLSKVRGWAGLILEMEENPLTNPTNIAVSFKEFIVVNLIVEAASYLFVKKRAVNNNFEYRLVDGSNKNIEIKNLFSSYVYDKCLIRLGCEESVLSFLSSNCVKKVFLLINQRIIFEIWHNSYENNLIQKAVCVLNESSCVNHTKNIQVVTCIDDREESLRRHYESINENIETFGYVGHFGLNILSKNFHEIYFRPLCPMKSNPKHYVWEDIKDSTKTIETTNIGKLEHSFFHHSKTPLGGAIFSLLLGPFAVLPLILNVFTPRLSLNLKNMMKDRFNLRPETRLNYEDSPDRELRGYTVL